MRTADGLMRKRKNKTYNHCYHYNSSTVIHDKIDDINKQHQNAYMKDMRVRKENCRGAVEGKEEEQKDSFEKKGL